MTSQAFSQVIHLVERSDFSLLRLYIEQEVSNADLQHLVQTIQNPEDVEVNLRNKLLSSHSHLFICNQRHASIHFLFQFDWIDVIKSRV